MGNCGPWSTGEIYLPSRGQGNWTGASQKHKRSMYRESAQDPLHTYWYLTFFLTFLRKVIRQVAEGLLLVSLAPYKERHRESQSWSSRRYTRWQLSLFYLLAVFLRPPYANKAMWALQTFWPCCVLCSETRHFIRHIKSVSLTFFEKMHSLLKRKQVSECVIFPLGFSLLSVTGIHYFPEWK